ncbi:MAG: phosphoglucomutase/phosphomannomutase family protein, partial [Rhodothermaceae bacterium]|nr:phosphoglucomutase/phosphomannomutase family protein [Rhodothermaceae bacterium]
MNEPLRFGTDGWRAVIAREFTFANLDRLARATAKWLKQSGRNSPTVIVGHDTRFLGRQFAEHVAKTLADEGAAVIL